MNVLRRHLAGASLVGVEQPVGERVVNFVFSCTDEVGSASLKILTAEIMGRQSKRKDSRRLSPGNKRNEQAA
jgi:predicted ribosome quality control (RQC) complex YloA/Tae2 family protein